jgi:hypothetical protein
VDCFGRREEACLADFIIGSAAWVGKVNEEYHASPIFIRLLQFNLGSLPTISWIKLSPLFLRINNSHKETLDLESTPGDTLPFEVTYENHGSQ